MELTLITLVETRGGLCHTEEVLVSVYKEMNPRYESVTRLLFIVSDHSWLNRKCPDDSFSPFN